MRDKVSKQRREAGMSVGRRLLDPEFRKSLEVLNEDGERPIVVAIWNDSVSHVLELIGKEGGQANLAVRRPDGGLTMLAVVGRFDERSPNPDDPRDVVAAPESTIGLVLDAILNRSEDFNIFLQESELSSFRFELSHA